MYDIASPPAGYVQYIQVHAEFCKILRGYPALAGQAGFTYLYLAFGRYIFSNLYEQLENEYYTKRMTNDEITGTVSPCSQPVNSKGTKGSVLRVFIQSRYPIFMDQVCTFILLLRIPMLLVSWAKI